MYNSKLWDTGRQTQSRPYTVGGDTSERLTQRTNDPYQELADRFYGKD